MKAVIQRVKNADVAVNGETVGKCGNGLMVLFGAETNDTPEDAALLAKKTAALRIFCDENGKMNRSVCDINGEMLVISQFTLCADVKKGNRPSFTKGASPDLANRLYEYFAQLVRDDGVELKTGWFGARMEVSLTNSGPFTLWLDTDDLVKQQTRSK